MTRYFKETAIEMEKMDAKRWPATAQIACCQNFVRKYFFKAEKAKDHSNALIYKSFHANFLQLKVCFNFFFNRREKQKYKSFVLCLKPILINTLRN